MAKSDIAKRPKRKARDTIHTLARAGISSIPIIGGPANELLSLVIIPSLEKRRVEWIESIAETLKGLEEKVNGFRIENLGTNEDFISIITHASQIAIRNHQKEKLEALRNAVLNTTLPNAPEANLQLMFLSFVDSLTPLHIRVLKLLYDKKSIPDYESREEFFKQIKQDLVNRGLVSSYSGLSLAQILRSSEQPLTNLGEQFLKFITSPIDTTNDGSSADLKQQSKP